MSWELFRLICIGAGVSILGLISYTYFKLWRMHRRNPQLTKAKLFLRFAKLHGIHKHVISFISGGLAITLIYFWMMPLELDPLSEFCLMVLLLFNLGAIYYASFLIWGIFRR